MAQNFIDSDRKRVLLLPPSLREWLPGDHLAWFVLDAVDEIDLSAFYAAYRGDGWGGAAFDPQMVALLLYAHAVGERSSRGIERRCREDVAFRVITANHIPDHATIARFRARHEQALAGTFTLMLGLCAQAGWCGWGWSRSVAACSPATRRLRRLTATPRSETRSSGYWPRLRRPTPATMSASVRRAVMSSRAELADRRSRRERLRRCKEQLEQEQAAEEAAYRANLEWRAAWEADQGRRLAGRRPTPPDLGALAARKVNTTDPDRRLMKRAGGKSVQGYNAQLVAGPGQIVLAAKASAVT